MPVWHVGVGQALANPSTVLVVHVVVDDTLAACDWLLELGATVLDAFVLDGCELLVMGIVDELVFAAFVVLVFDALVFGLRDFGLRVLGLLLFGGRELL